MIAILRRALDGWRGSGPLSITVPPMDGAMSPNQAIEEAPLVIEASAPDNLVHDGARVLFSSGGEARILRTDGRSGRSEPYASFDSPIAALAAHPGGGVAIGLDEGRIALCGGRHDGKVLRRVSDREVVCPTALLFAGESALLVALGSQRHRPEKWKEDLMRREAAGSVWRIDLESGGATCLADRLAYPYGLLPSGDGGAIVCESWRSQLVRVRPGRKPEIALSDIAGYPSRLAPTADGRGAWLAVFAPRSQLIEFILRERAFRERMMREIAPDHWLAPSLTPPRNFLEPMQGGALRMHSIVKPWAPTRSYGLAIRLDEHFRPMESYHSRADGRRHGVTTCLAWGDGALAASRGGDAILRLRPKAGNPA